jgi:hypothetical protein
VPFSQAQVVVNGYGSFPPDGNNNPPGGQFVHPAGIAVNSSGNGVPAGTVYVVDGNRIQRFGPSGAFQRLWGSNVIAPGKPGDLGEGFEICTVAADCRAGSGAGAGGTPGINFNGAGGVAINQANGDVYVWADNSRVIEFNAAGAFIRTWGWDVIAPGKPNDTGSGFEVCDATAGDAADGSDCQTGTSGANGGQFTQASGGAEGLAIDSSGNVWVPEGANRRIEEFDATGNFIAAYGSDVDALGGGGGLEKCVSTAPGACQAGTQGSGAGQFSASNPRDIAFDSAGNLYAIDSGNDRVQKFDPTLLASATDFAPSLFAAYTNGAPEHVIATQGGTHLVFSLENDVTALPSEQQLVEIDPADLSGATDTSLVGSGLNDIRGLAYGGASGTLYAATGDQAVSSFPVLAFGSPLPSPTVAFDPITAKTDTTATFSASIDPKGGIVGCKFQYSTDQDTWVDLPAPACDTLTIGGGAQAISANATGLIPNTPYFVRLQTSRPLVPNSTVTTPATAFNTDAVPPVVTDVGAIEINDTSVRVVGTIDPRHSATDYVVEYGTSPALGSSTAPLAIGDGATPLIVSQVVGGLDPNTTYYFKLVATNLTGPTASTVHTVHTRATPLPDPENRHWEMVSPPDKNYTGADNRVYYEATAANVSPDGNAVSFCTTALFGDPPGRQTQLCAPYLARRGSGGWQTAHPFPEYCYIDPVSGIPGYRLTVFPSRDYSHFVFAKGESAGCPAPPLSPDAPLRSASEGGIVRNLYFQDPAASPASYDLLTPHLSLNTGSGLDGRVVGGSDDFSHVVYKINSNQTAPPDSPPPGPFTKLYGWERQGQGACVQPGGCLALVSKDTNGVPVSSAVSSDGSRIFFQNPSQSGEFIDLAGPCDNAGCELYMREDATDTFDVSASECTLGPAACGSPETKADTFVTATPSADKAFFLSCAKLTDASSSQGGCVGVGSGVLAEPLSDGAKLYRWDRGAAPGQRLVDLTVDHEPSDGAQPNAGGILGTSNDGDIVFFTTRGQIVSGQPTAGSEEKLYRWQWNSGSPTVEYLGPYQGFKDGEGLDYGFYGEHRNVTPDGKYLVVYTKLALDPVADTDTDADAYRWDAGDGWLCLTCQAPGAPSAGDIDRESPDLSVATLEPSLVTFSAKSELSADGQRFFFGTPDALVPQDVNGQVSCPIVDEYFNQTPIRSCLDVYEWHDGTISLISSGTSDEPSRLIGSTPSGDDAFFYSTQRLVGWDVDSNVDIYDSRVGGGFPEPPAQPPSCEGEACRGAGTSAPNATGAGTAVFQGPGNPAPKHQVARKHHKKRHHKKRQHKSKKRQHKRQQRAANNDRRAGR